MHHQKLGNHYEQYLKMNIAKFEKEKEEYRDLRIKLSSLNKRFTHQSLVKLLFPIYTIY